MPKITKKIKVKEVVDEPVIIPAVGVPIDTTGQPVASNACSNCQGSGKQNAEDLCVVCQGRGAQI